MLGSLRRRISQIRKRWRRDHRLPDRYARSPEYARGRPDARWIEVEPELPLNRRPPVRLSRMPGELVGWKRDRMPEMGVLELAEAYLVGPRGWIVTRDRYLLPDHTIFRSRDRLPTRDFRGQVHRIRGTVASLASDNGQRNYGHFLYDALPRLELLRRAGISMEEIDWFYVGFPGRNGRRLVERIGIPPDRIIPVKKGVWIQADRVLAPTFPGTLFDHPRWVIDFLRRELLPPGTTIAPRRRLYVRRTKSRRIANEADVMPILEGFGFEAYEPEAHDDPPVDFAQAGAVVSLHGANMADICFCPEGARILELTPSGHLHPYWYLQAETAGLEHAYVVCQVIEQRAPTARPRQSDRDVVVDPEDLRNALQVMLGSTGPA